MRKNETKGKAGVKPDCKDVRFELVMEQGSEVYVVGTFNRWDPRAHPLSYQADHGSYLANVAVQPGRHEYKFVVNGKWRIDPKCPETTVNPFGSLNSVVVV